MKTIAESLKLPATTGIGSLPHHNIDAALEFAFQTSIPFLPQIPIRNVWEYMIPQALEGLPGLEADKDAETMVDLNVWTGRAHAMNQKLGAAFEAIRQADAFESFEPTSSTVSCWQPFLWEIGERGHKFAKIQIAGPLTCQWALRSKEGKEIHSNADLTSQIYRLLLARALAMTRKVASLGVQPILYIDEPAMFSFAQPGSAMSVKHAMSFQELRFMVNALAKENVIVGLHCCSDTDWASVLSLHREGLRVLSLDVGLSLEQLVKNEKELSEFLLAGGRLSLGVIPTLKKNQKLDAKVLFSELFEKLAPYAANSPEKIKNMLMTSIYTPACGLALHTTSEAEEALNALIEFQKLITYNFS